MSVWRAGSFPTRSTKRSRRYGPNSALADHPETPGQGRVLALDLGSRRIGVAVCDAGRRLASPLTVIVRSADPAGDYEAIRRLIAEEEVDLVVVGMPLSLDGSAGPAVKRARAEVAALAAA